MKVCESGGQIIAQGIPEEITKVKNRYTKIFNPIYKHKNLQTKYKIAKHCKRRFLDEKITSSFMATLLNLSLIRWR